MTLMFLLMPLVNASISSQSTIGQSFIYSSFGVSVILISLSCYFFDRKGNFLALIQLFSFIQFTFLLGTMNSRRFFTPFQLFESVSSNFIYNCAEEAIIVSGILTIFIIFKYSFKSKRDLEDFITVGMLLTMQDFIFFSSQNVKYFNSEGFENILGFSFAVFYFLALLTFLGLLVYSLKKERTLSNFIREDYKNSEIYYLSFIFQLIFTPIFSFCIEKQEIVKICLIAAVQVGVSND